MNAGPAPRTRVVLQARASSTRLPGKVLLPLAGMPVVVLAARRVMAPDFEIVVATSVDASDDAVECVCESAGLRVVRGPLHDVLGRYLLATFDMSPNDVCVRLTADNIFPDAGFLRDVLSVREAQVGSYVCFGTGGDGLPYGLTAEAFTVQALRTADSVALTSEEREHVTTVIARRDPMTKVAFPGSRSEYADLRCTIDTPDDYRRAVSVFANTSDPVGCSWRTLVQILSDQQ